MSSLPSISDIHVKTIDGKAYEFRTPTLYDLPKMRQRLRKEGVRRPLLEEYRAASLAGVAAMADATGEALEGERQSDLVSRWYEISIPLSENDLDEPDFEKRAAELAAREEERRAEIVKLYPEMVMIEANLDRHFPPWRDLRADADYYDEISRIDAVRLLLRGIDETRLPIDREGLVVEAAFGLVPDNHRMDLGTFSLGLLVPTEAEKKS